MSAIDPVSASALARTALPAAPAAMPLANAHDFGALLSAGLDQAQAKVAQADAMVRKFVLDETIPVHQVTHAIEEARLAIELALQVRSRMTEVYRDMMNMQL